MSALEAMCEFCAFIWFTITVVSLSQMLYVKCVCAVSLSQFFYVKSLCVFSRYPRCYLLSVCVYCFVIPDVIC